jgi:invasion protein IalB
MSRTTKIATIIITVAFAGVAHAAPADGKVGDAAWVKICPKPPKKDIPPICLTRTDSLDTNTGMVFAPVAIEEPMAGGEKTIRITLPHIMVIPAKIKNRKTGKEENVLSPVAANWVIKPGVQIKIDNGKAHKMEYSYCYRLGCIAETKASSQIISELRKGKRLMIAGQNGPRPMAFPVRLDGFSKAADGAPMSQEIYETKWKKRLEQLRKQQIETMKNRTQNNQ